MSQEIASLGPETFRPRPSAISSFLRSSRGGIAKVLAVSLGLGPLAACVCVDGEGPAPESSNAVAPAETSGGSWQAIAEKYKCERDTKASVRLVDADAKPTPRNPALLKQLQGAANMTCFEVVGAAATAKVSPESAYPKDESFEDEAIPDLLFTISVNPPPAKKQPKKKGKTQEEDPPEGPQDRLWKITVDRADVPVVTLQLNNDDGRPNDVFWQNMMRAARACFDSLSEIGQTQIAGNKACRDINHVKNAEGFPADPKDMELSKPAGNPLGF